MPAPTSAGWFGITRTTGARGPNQVCRLVSVMPAAIDRWRREQGMAPLERDRYGS